MLRLVAIPFAALLLSGVTPEDGANWVKEAEAKLYRWPEPQATVRFQVHTDSLDTLIQAMRKDLEKKPDPAGSRFVAALEKVEITGAIDTRTGKLETEIKLDADESDPRTQAAVDSIKQRLHLTIQGCFASLPLQDPSLLHKGAAVSSAEELDDERVVTSHGVGHGDTTVLHLARDTGLPRTIVLERMTIGLAYVEATRGHYVPASLELQPKGSLGSRLEISWQHEGDVWFPEHVRLSSKTAAAKIDFDHLVVEPKKR